MKITPNTRMYLTGSYRDFPGYDGDPDTAWINADEIKFSIDENEFICTGLLNVEYPALDYEREPMVIEYDLGQFEFEYICSGSFKEVEMFWINIDTQKCEVEFK